MKKILTFSVLMLFVVLAAGFVSAADPVLNSIGNKDAFEDTKLEFAITATDSDGSNTITLTNTGVGLLFPRTLTNNVTATWTYSFTPDDLGKNTVEFRLTDGAVTKTENITITVFPQLCEEGEVGSDLEIADLDLDEDEYFLGDDIVLDVDVDNDGTKDLDVNVEAFLYDVNEEDEIDNFDSNTVDINDGDTENFEVDLAFPFDNDLDEDGEFIIFVKAYEDGDEDSNCVQDSITVDLEREDLDVLVEDLRANPSSAEPGQTVEFSVDVLNVGSDDADDITIELVNSQLGINQESNPFDLERGGDNDDSASQRFTVRIPESANAGEYSFNVRVLDEDGDVFDRGEEFVTLTVSGQATPTAQLSLLQSSFEANAGSSLNMQVTVRNTGSSQATYTLDVNPVGGWAGTVSQVVSLNANSEQIVSVPLSVKSDATSGSYSALVELKAGGETLSSETATVAVRNTGLEPVTGGTVFRPVTGSSNVSTVFWIIADIALVVVIAYFLTLLFRKKK